MYLDENSALLAVTVCITLYNLLTTGCLLGTSVRGDLLLHRRMLQSWGMQLSVGHHARLRNASLVSAYCLSTLSAHRVSRNLADCPEEKACFYLTGEARVKPGLSDSMRSE